jgi:acetyl esterase/lipase
MWLHGGGWRFGDRRLAPDLRAFAQQAQLAVVSIDYRLSGEATFPAPVEDVKTAVRWVRCVADDFDFDTGRIGLWGSSAGGHLAACAALSLESEFLGDQHPGHSSAVHAVVDGYGPINFGRIDADRASMPTPGPISGKDAESVAIGHVLPAGDPDSFESRLLGTPVSSSPREVELADPVHYVRGAPPPFLILHGEADALIPCSQSRSLFNALQAAGGDVTLVLFEKLEHGFLNNPALAITDYGARTVYQSAPPPGASAWSSSPEDSISSMVSSFFRHHLAMQRS